MREITTEDRSIDLMSSIQSITIYQKATIQVNLTYLLSSASIEHISSFLDGYKRCNKMECWTSLTVILSLLS